jgi:hypothetical protein
MRWKCARCNATGGALTQYMHRVGCDPVVAAEFAKERRRRLAFERQRDKDAEFGRKLRWSQGLSHAQRRAQWKNMKHFVQEQIANGYTWGQAARNAAVIFRVDERTIRNRTQELKELKRPRSC